MSTSAPLLKPPAVFLTIPAQCVFPETCANCNGPAETHARVARQVMRTTRTYQVPHCRACLERQQAHSSKQILLWFVVAGAARHYARTPSLRRCSPSA